MQPVTTATVEDQCAFDLLNCTHCGEPLSENPTDCICPQCGFKNCDRP